MLGANYVSQDVSLKKTLYLRSQPGEAKRGKPCRAANSDQPAPSPAARKSERSNSRRRRQGSVSFQTPSDPAAPSNEAQQRYQPKEDGDASGNEQQQSDMSWWNEVLAEEEEEADRSRAADAARSAAGKPLQDETAEKLTQEEQRAKDAVIRRRVAQFFRDEGIASEVDRDIDPGIKSEEEERPMVQAAEFWDRPVEHPHTADLEGHPSPTRAFEPGNLWDAELAAKVASDSSNVSDVAPSSGTTGSGTTAKGRSRQAARKDPLGGDVEDVLEALGGSISRDKGRGNGGPDLARALRGKDMSEKEIRGRALNDLATEGADVDSLIDQHRDIIDEDLLLTLFGRVEAAHKYGEDEAVVGALLALWRRLRAEVERGQASPTERLLDEALQILTNPSSSQLTQLEDVRGRLAAAFVPGGTVNTAPLDLFAIAEALASGGEPPTTSSAAGEALNVEHVPLEGFIKEVAQLLGAASAANTALQQLVDSGDLSGDEQEAAEGGLKDRLLSADHVQTVLTIADTLRGQPGQQPLETGSNADRRVTF